MEFLDPHSDPVKQKRQKHILSFVISLLIAVIAGVICVFSFPQRLENMAQDAMYQNAGVIPDNIKIIAIDEKTLDRLGPYSDWDRAQFASLIEILNSSENRPLVIGIDVVFSGSDNSADDIALVDACRAHNNIVLASTVNFDSYLLEKDGEFYRAQYVASEGKPFDELASVCDYGFTNAIYDNDGIVRQAYTVIESKYDGKKEQYASFSYIVASKVSKIKSYNYKVEPEFVSKPGEFEKVSMADVLDGVVKPEYFENAIVLVGAYEEGMMDAYRVPVDYSAQMYGVEMQANYVHALLNDNIIYPAKTYLQVWVAFILVFLYSILATNQKISQGIVGGVLVGAGYLVTVFAYFKLTGYKMNVLAVPAGVVLGFVAAVLFKYVRGQKKRIYQMQKTLFSMAEAMAETIEGRTPYNANHTKNVAKRSIEMLDYINRCHKEKKTDLYFTKAQKRQMYLAAMLHDVGKMDVPLEVMDKPTKLGERETELKNRLEIISLRIKNDMLQGVMPQNEADRKLEKIEKFLQSLGLFNCGKPLSEEEWVLVDEMAKSVYVSADGKRIPYMNEAEIEDLHIKAGTLSESERAVMQSHVTYTDKILSHIHFGEQFCDVRRMAADHHELLNGKGYPRGVGEKELDTMTRILTIMDIYDSLIADDRPYKKAKPVKVAFEILDEEAQSGKIDKELLQFAKELYLIDN